MEDYPSICLPQWANVKCTDMRLFEVFLYCLTLNVRFAAKILMQDSALDPDRWTHMLEYQV
jgi:hypothetical protein